MLTHIRTWQVLLSQLAVVVAATVGFALFVHFPDVARRPEPPPGVLFLVVFSVTTVLLIFLGAAGVRSPDARSWIAIVSAIVLWCFACYSLMFVWLNTFGS